MLRSRALRYGAALVALAICGVIPYVFQPYVGERFPLAAFPLAVLAAAWVGGFGPALLVTLGGCLAFAPRLDLRTAADAATLFLLASIGVLIALLVRHMRRHAGRERSARADAERQVRQTHRLHQLTATLLQGRTPDDVVSSSLPELLHALGAGAGALLVIDDEAGEYRLAQALGYGGRVATPADAWPLVPGTPLADAILRRELTVLEAHARPAAAARPGDPIQELQEGDVVVPVTVGGHAIGAFLFRMPAPRLLTEDEREFLVRAGRYTGQALDRARLYELAQRSRAESDALRERADSELRERQKVEERLRLSEAKIRALAARTSRLYALSAGLSEAASLNAVGTVIVRNGKIVVGAAAGSVAMLVDGGTHFETLYAEEYGQEATSSPRRFPAAGGLCATAAVETQRPVFVGSFVEWQEKYPESASIAADGGYESSAALPLVADGAVFGVLSFHFTLPVNFDEEYSALLTSVAQHCAQALDRARLYESAERARAEAEAANQSKDDFLSTVSHELRTPLNAMLGWAAMLRSGTIDASRTQRAIEAIFNNATRQGRLIEELLDVSRIVAGRASIDRQDVDLGENLRGAVETMMPIAATKGVELRLDAPPGIGVIADPRRLEQVFLNLLSNAVKFTPRGGHITVGIEASDTHAEVRVADTGAGIDAGFLPHVFDRFRQGDSAPTRAAGGLGLGLFISRQLVEAQGGSIRAESAGAGKGATFTLSLPASSTGGTRHLPAATAAEAAPPEQPMPALDGISVLLVDDEPDAREVMASALESCGATVVSASSAREALETLSHTDVDLVLSDIAMPGQDGYALIRDIRAMPSARVATIPAAAVTAHARDDERERALSAGFHMHLTKPVHPVALATAVAALATSRTHGRATGTDPR